MPRTIVVDLERDPFGSVGLLLALHDPDLDPYIVKMLYPDPYIEYADPQHCPEHI